ncbi:aldo/keto reductase [Natronoflexus pectinivorans]|uniref:Diketogulonate reductase-like aldo/keto reductase n=1 Tax=Natronoflexus pectinivorans TaxID=682526 RepID=A0A4R2GN58_9BACT|nr:aldo/keto reductase [Natronoflexus pectinivorans]TCO10683.1 diketogulonate reductase-like aldo/keto reductase [Natronoflexus pectinivorans]
MESDIENNRIGEDIPRIALSNGEKIPVVGLGTFGSDNYNANQIAGAVDFAVRNGYRHIDCASVYMNESEIGNTISELIIEGVVNRQDLWITSKVWNDAHDKVIESCKKSLKDLQLDYLDLYLVHWPFPNYHAPGCDGDARNPDSRPYNHDAYMETWRQMEQLVEMGLVKSIGTSNMTIPKMELLLKDAKIKPVVNEMEIHPHFQQPELFNYLVGKNIQPIGYSPIGSPKRPERDRTEDDTVDIEDPVIVKIAERLKLHPAEVCIKWGVQRGEVVIPFSVSPVKIVNNLKAVSGEPISSEEMKQIAGIDKNCRLIKGQVFLWEGAKGWEDLWDLDGKITN